jgi:hypothetical protein
MTWHLVFILQAGQKLKVPEYKLLRKISGLTGTNN